MYREGIATGAFAAACLLFLSACASESDTEAAPTVTVTAAQPSADAVTDTVTPATTLPDPAATTTPVAAEGQTFIRIDQTTYDIGLPDVETAVFTSGDGSIHCSFTAEHGQYAYPQRMFAIDETVGGCLYGMEDADGVADYVSITTDATVQPTFAEPQDGISPTFPTASATLDTGEFVHLGKIGCFAPTASEISCTKFTTGEAFSIDGSPDGAGFGELDNEQVMAQLTDDAGYTQVLSRVIDIPFNSEDGVRCFYDTTVEERYSCGSLNLAVWEPTEGPGPANILAWELQDGNAEFVRAFAANPGFDLYESRQPLEPGLYRLDDGLVADYDGTRITFTTQNGDSFWTDGPDYGTQTGSG